MMNDIRGTVLKLNSSNYQTWKFKLQLILVKEGLWDVVTGNVPENPDAAWLTKDGNAKATIGLLVEDNHLIHIKNLANACDYWNVLKDIYEKPNLVNKVVLYKKLWKSFLGDKTMEEHVGGILTTVDELRALGEDIKDKMLIALLLGSLTDIYDPLISALEVKPEAELTVTFVKEKLLQAYQRQIGDSNDNQQAYKSFGSHKKKFDLKKVRCQKCGKHGHFKNKCPIEENKPKEAKKAVSAITNSTCYSAIKGDRNLDTWCVDSGASSHMCNDKSLFNKLETTPKEMIKVADGRYVKSTASGIVQVGDITLTDVSYVPDLESNLMSVGSLTKTGHKLVFNEEYCEIFKANKRLSSIKCRNGLYELKNAKSAMFSSSDIFVYDCIHTWHRRFGHRNLVDVKKMFEDGCFSGVKLKSCNCPKENVCVTCCEGKLSKQKYPKESKRRTTGILDLVHSDLCGPFDVPTPRGNKYLLTIIDDFSRYVKHYFLKKKSEAIGFIKEFIQYGETQYGKTVKIFRSDRGGEYMSNEIDDYFRSKGIVHQLSSPKCPQQNGVAERKNRYVVEMARCLLFQSGLDKKYWGEAVNTAIYVENRLAVKFNHGVTPYEKWVGVKPNLNYFKIFGSSAYVYDTNPRRKKLDKKCKELVFVGYSEETKGYRFLDTATNNIVVSRDAKFEESKVLKPKNRSDQGSLISIRLLSDKSFGNVQESTEEESEEEFEDARQEEDELENQENIVDETQDNPEEHAGIENAIDVPNRVSTRSNKGRPPARLIACTAIAEITEPRTFKEALSLPEKEKWLIAMKEEVDAINENDTWDLVSLPVGRKTVGCKWVYKVKNGLDGQVRFKARLVAQGYSQKFGEDYNEVFAPVVKQTVLRCFLAVATLKKMEVLHIDVKNAFLNGELLDDVYMKQPLGFEVKNKSKKVYKLKKSLYGLKQSARCWNEKLHSTLLKLGFRRGQADPCIYNKQEGELFIFILLYVDDMLVACQDINMTRKTIDQISKVFKITNLGPISTYLGVQVERDEQGVYYIHQEKYIDHVLTEYNLKDSKTSKIPMDPGYFKELSTTEDFLQNNDEYRRIIGSLLYLVVNSRPDIAVSVSILSRKVSKPTSRDLIELRRVLKYLKGSKDLKLKLGGFAGFNLEGFADSDWAGDLEDRKSTSGYIFKFGGGIVSWGCKKQQNITLSSTEAEYVALSEGCQELEYLRLIFQDFKISIDNILMKEDNQSCLKLLDDKINNRTRHIDVKYHYVKEMKKDGKVKFIYCQSNEMLADMMTKPLTSNKLEYFKNEIGLTI